MGGIEKIYYERGKDEETINRRLLATMQGARNDMNSLGSDEGGEREEGFGLR